MGHFWRCTTHHWLTLYWGWRWRGTLHHPRHRRYAVASGCIGSTSRLWCILRLLDVLGLLTIPRRWLLCSICRWLAVKLRHDSRLTAGRASTLYSGLCFDAAVNNDEAENDVEIGSPSQHRTPPCVSERHMLTDGLCRPTPTGPVCNILPWFARITLPLVTSSVSIALFLRKCDDSPSWHCSGWW